MSGNRVNYVKEIPEAFRQLLQLSGTLHKGRLGGQFLELVFLRVSQINGCAYCMDMHASTLRKAGTPARKLDTLAGWRETPFFEPRERAALAWAEALTTIAHTAPADAAYEALPAWFDDAEISELTMAIGVINAWNRLGVGLRTPLS